MIPFFRKTRKKLADDNKPMKYMRYAIGEIVLVVIGILIALSINNWNEKRKSKNLENQFLHRLQSDLSMDFDYYNRRIQESDSVIRFHNKIILEMYKTQKNFEEVKNLFDHLRLSSEHLTIQNSTYVEMTNSGHLNLIRNIKLKKDLINYYLNNEQAAKHIKEYNEFTVQYLISLNELIPGNIRVFGYNKDLLGNMDYRFDDWNFINNIYSTKYQSLESTIIAYKNKHDTFLNYFKQLRIQSVNLSNDIQEELKY